jgi:hypothetical protein
MTVASPKKALRLVGLGLALAVAAGLVANVLDLSDTATYMLAGAVIALLVAFGVPWVFGEKFELVRQNGGKVGADKSAVAAGDEKDPSATIQAGTIVVSQGWDKVEVTSGDEPIGMTAGWTFSKSVALSEDLPEPAVSFRSARLDEAILGPNGSGE